MPENRSINQQLEDAKMLAVERCVSAGGNPRAVEIVEVDLIPMSYVTNGATRVVVRVVSDLVEGQNSVTREEDFLHPEMHNSRCLIDTEGKASNYEFIETIDFKSYRPRIEGDLWYVSQTDLDFLQDGTGVLGVGSCGEPYPTYLACKELLRSGTPIIIRRQGSIKDAETVLVGGFMASPYLPILGAPYTSQNHTNYSKGSPSVYEERVPGLDE